MGHFVVTDPERRILTANPAFLDLAQLATEEQARGEPLDRWVGRPGVDVEALVSNMREHGSVRRFSTIVRGQYGSHEDVEISAVSVLSFTTELPYFSSGQARMNTWTVNTVRRPLQVPHTAPAPT